MAAIQTDGLTAEGAITRWLRRAPQWLFVLYGGLAGFGTYFAMYAFRKPFTAASYAHVTAWPFAIDFKILLVIAQVAGYATAKFMGIKIVSEMPPSRRAVAILTLIAAAETALVGFALLPAMLAPICLFLNGLGLGMIWGLVFGFLEGRRVSEVLGAMLCASFILSSGLVNSAGEAVMLDGLADERWMPAVTGLMFAPVLLLSVWALAQLPPPDARDELERLPRTPMDASARRQLFTTFAGPLVALVATYVLLTAMRDFRDNFATEIWGELGFSGEAGIFTMSEIPVAIAALLGLAMMMRVRDNRRAVLWNLALILLGLAVTGVSTGAYQLGLLGPVGWMIAVGAGLYLAYTPFNALLFDRLVAAARQGGNAGFLIYLADASGYCGTVLLLLVRSFIDLHLRWTTFLCELSLTCCMFGIAAVGFAFLRLKRMAGLYSPPTTCQPPTLPVEQSSSRSLSL